MFLIALIKLEITILFVNVQTNSIFRSFLNPMFWLSLLMENIWNGYTLSIKYIECAFK